MLNALQHVFHVCTAVLLQNIQRSVKVRMASGLRDLKTSRGKNLYDDVVDQLVSLGKGNQEECKNRLELDFEVVMAIMPKSLGDMATAINKMKEAGGLTKEGPGCRGQGIKR